MRVLATLLSYPPARWIGSELMTHRILRELAGRGHDITVTVRDPDTPWIHEGIPVSHRREAWARDYDVVICHADFASTARDLRRWRGTPIVAICHNSGLGVRVGLSNTDPALVVCNSTVMALELGEVDAIVVTPPLDIPTDPVTGDLVTVVNLNENKVGPFWDLAAAQPDTGFLAVLGGYGEQVVPDQVPANVTVLDPVPAHDMAREVWARTRVLLAPSGHESWSMTAAEAMAHGIPVIAQPTPGLVANLGPAGTYADRDDPNQWIAALEHLRDPATWTAASTASRTRACAHQASADLGPLVHAIEALEARDAAALG